MPEPDLIERVLGDNDNDLRSNVTAFVASGDPVWYVDRHVFFEVPDDAELDCEAAIELARLWSSQRGMLEEQLGVRISVPYAILDDEWFAADRDRHAPPPHVYLVMSRTGEPVEDAHGAVPHVGPTGQPKIDDLLARQAGRLRLLRIEPSPFDEKQLGAWVLEIVQ